MKRLKPVAWQVIGHPERVTASRQTAEAWAAAGDDLRPLYADTPPITDALEQLLIAIGMGWDLAGFAARGYAALGLPDDWRPSALAEALTDIISHRHVWRGLLLAQTSAVRSAGDVGYWQHELTAFDRTTGAIVAFAADRDTVRAAG